MTRALEKICINLLFYIYLETVTTVVTIDIIALVFSGMV